MRPFLPAAACLLLAACAGGAEPAPAPPPDISGSWQVRGTTTEVESGATRDIEGMIVVVQTGGAYRSSFHLATDFPTEEGPQLAEVIGTGRGDLRDRVFAGTAETQLILSMVPGEAGRFPWTPRVFGPRLRSQTTGTLQPDGSLVFDAETEGLEGEVYAPTRTRLVGVRMPEP
ncbi:MAG: hypothetical protein QNK03_05165 [Myxococcota bacterium]|nr:hypothetical protein [Myxococcota bacterium]